MPAQPQALGKESQAIRIRRATPADAEVCGRICLEAFGTVADRQNLPRGFPASEIPTECQNLEREQSLLVMRK